jgi:predicted ATPase/DNA-binding winged helix-turn-helix (wHTH) protein
VSRGPVAAPIAEPAAVGPLLKDDVRKVHNAVFAFGRFRLNPAERLLLEDGKPLPLGGRALEILVTLVEFAGETVPKEQLIRRVWPDTVVDEGALRVHVAKVRKALGDGRDGNRFIGNIPGRGYSFVAPVTHEQQHVPPSAPESGPTLVGNLPAQLTRVIGRGDIIATVVERVARQRVLTIVGPGGIGKTTVAVAAAEALSRSFADGVWFVSLASLQDPALVPSAVSAVLGSTPGIGDPLSSLVAWLRDKRALIVLDSCEHVVAAVAAAVETMLKGAPQLAILATSQEPLRAEGELLLRVPPLESPPEKSSFTATEALGFPAVELFNERALATLDSFVLTDVDVPVTLEICRRLDGVPLAIELAAARVGVLDVRGLAAQLDDRFAVLTGGRRTALPRQQTLRATIDWSYELLSEPEQRLLCRLAVFSAGFTLETAVAVTRKGVDTTAVVSEGVASLIAKSLVSRDGLSPTGRWRLLETIRAYALEKLTESGEASAFARRHAEYFRTLVVPDETNPVLRISTDDVARYGREIDNIRAALAWSFSPGGDAGIGITLTAAFAPVWLHLALVVECRERTEYAVNVLGSGFDLCAPLERRLCIALGVALTLTMGPVERTRTILTRARKLAESVGDVEAELRMLWAQWSMENNMGEYRLAQATAQRFSLVAQRTGDAAFINLAEHFVGFAQLYDGQLREARDRLEHSFKNYVAPPNGRHRILFHYDQRVLARARLARVLCLQGYVDRAREQAQISFEEAQATDAGFTLCWVLHHAVCPIALMTGDIDGADRAVATMGDLATRFDADLWKILMSCWEGKALVERRGFARGCALLRKSLDTCDQTGWRICNPEFLGVLAQGLAELGQLDTALVTVDKALASADTTGALCDIPELLRIKGEILLRDGANNPLSAAEACFLGAMTVAQQQGAAFWELRATLSLAQMWSKHHRQTEAKQVLALVYDKFTEGFETTHLVSARDLLRRLT